MTGNELSFQSNLRATKTEAGRAVLRGAAFAGSRQQRMLLIMIDGSKALRELAAPAQVLGLDGSDVLALVEGGWVALDRVAHTTTATLPLATERPLQPAQPPEPPRSLAAGKMLAIDLLGVMLPGRERDLIQMAGLARTDGEVRRWLELAAGEVAELAGSERGRLFIDKVWALLPEGEVPPLLDSHTSNRASRTA